QRERAPAHTAVRVRERDRGLHAVELLDATGTLRPRERVDGADPDRIVGRAAGARDAGHEHHAERNEREPPHRSTASTFANACVAADAVQVPAAQRCQPNSSPAPRSTGSAAVPYAGTCTSANSTAEPTIATAAPNRSSRPNARRR